MSNETPETAGTRGTPATRNPGTPVPDAADSTDTTEHQVVEPPIAEPLGAGSHVARASEPAPDASEPASSEPASSEPASSEPVTLVEPAPRERTEYIERADEPVEVTAAGATEAEPIVATSNAGAAYVAAATATDAPVEPPVQTVYVHAPVPPKRRGNRGIGSLIALASTVVFAAIYAGIALVVMPLFAPKGSIGFDFLLFIRLPIFYVPVLVFLVAFVLLVLIVNRANWWAYVLGSFIVALLVYFVSIGILLLLRGVIDMTPAKAFQAFGVMALSPLLIAAIVAREVPIWFGAAIAARGRRQKQRNAEEKAAFDTELESNRSDFTRSDYGTN